MPPGERELGLCGLCQHDFEHNRYAEHNASIIGFFFLLLSLMIL